MEVHFFSCYKVNALMMVENGKTEILIKNLKKIKYLTSILRHSHY